MHPADQYLQALGKQRATFQTFPDHDQASGGPQILHGPHKAVHKRLERLNHQGHGVFVMVNHGDLQGRRATNVTDTAAYFVDLDGTPLPTVWPTTPTLVIESSPGRYHAYWRVTNAPTDDFERVQKHLALILDGDPNVHDLPRVMRLPGYQHQKRDPFTTRILQAEPTLVDHAEFCDLIALPKPKVPLPDACRRYVQRHQKRKQTTKRDPLESATERITGAQEGTRNDTLFRTAAAVANDVQAGKIDRHEAETALTDAALKAGLPDFEAKRTIHSALRYAQ